MTSQETPEPQTDDAAVATAPDESAPPAPEPWTPERVVEWNRYYDVYVASGVVLLVLISSIHKVVNPSLWPMLATGRLIAARGPVTTDPFSLTMVGARWVNIPWLFELLNASLYDLASRFAASTNAEQVAAGTLVLVNALVRALTAIVLLRLRKPGPGLWWAAVCAMIALGGMLTPTPGAVSPIVPTLGGIALPATVDPATFGLLFLAIEFVLLHRTMTMGRPGAIYGLLPLFLLWANFDGSFLIGLLVLALAAIGHAIRPARRGPRDGERRTLAPTMAPVMTLGCAAICLLNPSHIHAFSAAAAPYLTIFLKEGPLSFFGSASRRTLNELHGPNSNAYGAYVGYYFVLVIVGLLSFVVNRRRFALGRLLVFVSIAALWGAFYQAAPIFAVVLAVTLALNGQEWYLDKFGTEGRLGSEWATFSIGGRVVTLIAISAFIFKGLTGVGATLAEPAFGLGVNVSDFPFEAAAAAKSFPIEGNVLNTTNAQGDAMIWRSEPTRKPYIDSRLNLYPAAFRREFADLRVALKDDKVEVWKPILDKHNITAVMIPMRQLDPSEPAANRTFVTLKASSNWIPFYDDGSVVMFGRADAPADDLAYFKANDLRPELAAFKRDARVPSAERTPTPSSWLDKYFPNRGGNANIEPHVWSAVRWMNEWSPTPGAPPDLAQCLMAIREARTAIAREPDDPSSWRVLNQAYEQLALAERGVLERGRTGAAIPRNFFVFRLRQRAAVLHYAIQATPPPRTEDARTELANLNQQLAEVYLALECNDLARDRLADARALTPAGEFDKGLANLLTQLDKQVEDVNGELNDLTAEQQAGPLQRAEVALSRGAVGLAIIELEEAESSGLAPGIKARLIDLYCQIGEPDRAFELLGGNVNDPALSTGPGTGAYRQGLVNFLIGSYDLAASLWRDRAIPELRTMQTMQALEAGRAFLQGSPRGATTIFQELPGRVGNEATWEYELGLCLLEAGQPKEAGTHFANALTLEPKLSLRPLIAEYLEKIGVPVPPAPEEPAEVAAPKPTLPAPGGNLLDPALPGVGTPKP